MLAAAVATPGVFLTWHHDHGVCGVGVATQWETRVWLRLKTRFLQPLNGGGRLVGKNLDEFRASLVTGGLEGILVESLDTVANAKVDLSAKGHS